MNPQMVMIWIMAKEISRTLKRTPYIEECLRRFREGVEANKARIEFRRKSRIKLFGRGVVVETWISRHAAGLKIEKDWFK